MGERRKWREGFGNGQRKEKREGGLCDYLENYLRIFNFLNPNNYIKNFISSFQIIIIKANCIIWSSSYLLIQAQMTSTIKPSIDIIVPLNINFVSFSHKSFISRFYWNCSQILFIPIFSLWFWKICFLIFSTVFYPSFRLF